MLIKNAYLVGDRFYPLALLVVGVAFPFGSIGLLAYRLLILTGY
jgi:hypothetical protein